jgi:hypothetical protein
VSVSHELSGRGLFQKQLAYGQMAETLIAQWLISRGIIVMPVYDIEYETGKGPRVFGASINAAAPDLLVWCSDRMLWCEAKHKSVFTRYRKADTWTTGIDLHHWEHYRQVARSTRLPVWLLFLHRCSTPDAKDLRFAGCPPECPVGLFGGSIERLANNISHTSDRHGRHGMIYWAHDTLKLIAPLEEVLKASATRPRLQ